MHRFLLLSLLTILLVACGQIGPLYLPEKEAAPAPPVTEPAEEGQVKPAEGEVVPPVEAK